MTNVIQLQLENLKWDAAVDDYDTVEWEETEKILNPSEDENEKELATSLARPKFTLSMNIITRVKLAEYGQGIVVEMKLQSQGHQTLFLSFELSRSQLVCQTSDLPEDGIQLTTPVTIVGAPSNIKRDGESLTMPTHLPSAELCKIHITPCLLYTSPEPTRPY